MDTGSSAAAASLCGRCRGLSRKINVELGIVLQVDLFFFVLSMLTSFFGRCSIYQHASYISPFGSCVGSLLWTCLCGASKKTASKHQIHPRVLVSSPAPSICF